MKDQGLSATGESRLHDFCEEQRNCDTRTPRSSVQSATLPTHASERPMKSRRTHPRKGTRERVVTRCGHRQGTISNTGERDRRNTRTRATASRAGRMTTTTDRERRFGTRENTHARCGAQFNSAVTIHRVDECDLRRIDETSCSTENTMRHHTRESDGA